MQLNVLVNYTRGVESRSGEYRTGTVGEMHRDPLTAQIIAGAIEVHKHLGPGLLESAYRACLCWELRTRRLHVDREVALPIRYKGANINAGYRLDLVVNNKVLVELKAVESLHAVHTAQVLTYLKLTNLQVALLINFNVPLLRDGIVRLVL